MSENENNLVNIPTPRLLFTSAETGAGVSTVFLGLLVALSKHGVATAVANIGPSLVQTTHYRRLSGRFAHTIDLWSLSREQALQSFARLSTGSDLVLFSGDKGIYDSLFPNCWVQHEAAIAEAFQMPVILVLDVKGYQETIAALVKGLSEYYPGVRIAGVIANRVANRKHNHIIRKAIDSLRGPIYLGGVPIGDSSILSSGSSEEERVNPSLLPRTRILGCGELVGKNVDLEALLNIARSCREIQVPYSEISSANSRVRVAVADDVAFHLTIQDNLDLLRRAGAKLVAFSPIADYKLPADVQILYLPSGYLQLYAADLKQNESMLREIQQFAQRGGVIIAEGSAAAYLCRRIVLANGEIFDMVGLLPGVANAVKADTDWGTPLYCEVTAKADSPLAKTGQVSRGYRDTRWLIRLEQKLAHSFKVLEVDITTGEGSKGLLVYEDDGLMPMPNILASTVQLHWASNPDIAENLIKTVAGRGV